MKHSTHSLTELRKQPHWSFSRINALVNFCSLKWAFQYVYRAEPEFTPLALVFGKAWHSALDYACQKRLADEPMGIDEVRDLFSDILGNNLRTAVPAVKFDEDESVDTLIQSGRAMLGVYLSEIDPHEKILSTGLAFSTVLTDAEGVRIDKPLIGEFDCVVEKDREDIIVDWKTSARRWPKNKADHDLQPTCYLCAYRNEGMGRNASFRFDVVTKTKTPAYEQHCTQRRPDDFQRLGQIVRMLERRVWIEAFTPADQSWECGDCPYGSACRSWHRSQAKVWVLSPRVEAAVAEESPGYVVSVADDLASLIPGDGSKPSLREWDDLMTGYGIAYEGSPDRKRHDQIVRRAVEPHQWLSMEQIRIRAKRLAHGSSLKDLGGAVSRLVPRLVNAGILDRMYLPDGQPVYAWHGAEPEPETERN